ncbi:L,D-transpeptidase [Methylobacterium sp. BTF04]|uniref:L,D-transpeptidase n=1 Tax=Methylobacterium sp. BTF04 TaxID=2708300 RepID=UPI0032B18C70
MTLRRIVTRGGLAAVALACLSGTALAEQARPADKADSAGKAEPKDQPPLTRETIDGATFSAPKEDEKTEKTAGRDKAPQPLLIKVQVLLDRGHASPGAIDGRDGDNMRAALTAFAAIQNLPKPTGLSADLLDKLQAASTGPVLAEYTISEADAAGPYVDKIPAKMEDQSDLDAMGYTSPREMLAERFHMAPDLLTALNPNADFGRTGTSILVAAVKPMETGKPGDSDKKESGKKEPGKKDSEKPEKDIVRIAVDKDSHQVRAFSKDGTLRATYPASIGSEEKPAPSGEATVEGVAFRPTYTYNPKYKFDGVKSKSKFTIAPGPNNPVGLVWIDLSIPSYGIHGTPEPEKVGKTESHGCIRLTNWDARDLASRTERGAKVEFADK